MMERLEKKDGRYDDKNEKFVNSYAQAVKVSINPDTTCKQQHSGSARTRRPILWRDNSSIYWMNTLIERGGNGILLFHNLPESKKDTGPSQKFR